MFIVWDKDNTFHDWQRDINDNTAENVLVRRALAVPEWRRLYLEAFHEAAETASGGSGYLAGEETRVYSLIREAAYADPYKVNTMFAEIVPLTNETFEAAHQYIRDFFRNRASIVQAAIARDGFTQTPGALDVYASSATNYAYNCPVLTPGSLARLKIANGPAAAQATGFPLPRTLAGISISIAGKDAPLLSVSPIEVQFQVPSGVLCGPQPLTILKGSVSSHTIRADIRPSNAGIVAVTHTNWALVGPSNPAQSGEYLILFVTGLGTGETVVPDGEPTPLPGVVRMQGTVTAIVNGDSVPTLFAGLAPGLIGVQQVILQWPDTPFHAQRVPFSLSVNGETGNQIWIETK